jgi:lambda family phage portal protein
MRDKDLTAGQLLEATRSDYSAMRDSRYRKRRQGLAANGAGADFHYSNESKYLTLMEAARDMDRNEAVVGTSVDRAVENTVQDGFTLQAQTGDKELDAGLEEKWNAWAQDPEACDLAGEMTFTQLVRLSLRATFVDGDIIHLFNESGALEAVEAHRCRTPKNTKRNVIHGVLLDNHRRRLQYWLTKDDVDPLHPLRTVAEIQPFSVRDDAGQRLLAHVYNPRRVSQTRGITAFAPVFDVMGQFDDLFFAKLVQAQAVSAIGILSERAVEAQLPGKGAPLGAQETQTLEDGNERRWQKLGMAMYYRGAPGEKLSAFSGNVPNAEFFPHVKLILQLIGINLGLPLCLLLLDASETNFSGFRGAVDQARLGFAGNQQMLIRRQYRPVYRWKVDQFVADDPAIRKLAEKVAAVNQNGDGGSLYGPGLYNHRWITPAYPYIEPLKDATADLLRVRNTLISPRRRCTERKLEWTDIVAETVEDNALAIETALTAAAKLNGTFPEAKITWRDLIMLPMAEGVSLRITPDGAEQEKKGSGAKGQESGEDSDA